MAKLKRTKFKGGIRDALLPKVIFVRSLVSYGESYVFKAFQREI